MFARSFRLVAPTLWGRRLIPGRLRAKQAPPPAFFLALGSLALCLLAAGCGGGGGGGSTHVRQQVVKGPGYRFAAPTGWNVRRSRLSVAVAHGTDLIEVSAFPLVKPYRASLFDRVALELRTRMQQIATQTGGTLADAGSVTAAGVRSHVYRVTRPQGVDEYTFVLDGTHEYQLLCRAPKPGTTACSQLVASFSLAA